MLVHPTHSCASCRGVQSPNDEGKGADRYKTAAPATKPRKKRNEADTTYSAAKGSPPRLRGNPDDILRTAFASIFLSTYEIERGVRNPKRNPDPQPTSCLCSTPRSRLQDAASSEVALQRRRRTDSDCFIGESHLWRCLMPSHEFFKPDCGSSV